MSIRNLTTLLLLFTVPATIEAGPTSDVTQVDVCVYGATPGGITAAIAAKREGASVVLLEQTRHVGGLSTSGLNRDEADHMVRATLGGLCDRFTRAASGAKDNYPGARTWESHVAEKVLLEMLTEADVPVRYQQRLSSVRKDGPRLTSVTMSDGSVYGAKVFIDATYEGDLLASAGVSYVLGRESQDEYQESLAGVRYPDAKIAVSPYDEDGKLLPGVMPGEPPVANSGSPVPNCYNIRLNLSTNPKNQVEIEKPERYDPRQYELLARCIEAGKIKNINEVLALYGMRGGKMECNNGQYSIVSLSVPGLQTEWSEATFEERERIHQAYQDYTRGLLWFLKSDERVPAAMRKDMARFGLCKDEWTDNGHWPWYLYVREARRMKGRDFLTQSDITTDRDKPDVIHLGSHYIDSHQTARYATDDGHFINEGRVWQQGKVYDIPYRTITPRAKECTNLLVPVCVSASHVAFSTIRLEPTWMHLGEVSGIAAVMACKDDRPVQEVPIERLQAKIRQAGIPLTNP